MKVLLNGKWCSDYAPGTAPEGIAADLAPGVSRGTPRWDLRAIELQPHNCHLYVSYACPFAHRVIIARALAGLDGIITMSVLNPDWSGPDGWVFSNGPDCTPDTVNGKRALHEVYTLAEPNYTGKVTVPVLWAKRERKLVSTESLEALRILSSTFRPFHRSRTNLCPPELQAEIDELNTFIDSNISSGVYAATPGRNPSAHAENVERVFDALSMIEERLQGRDYLVGDSLTESDIILFTTAIRFDVVYHDLFKYDTYRISQFPSISAHMARMGSMEPITGTIKFDHIIKHYYTVPEFAEPTGSLLMNHPGPVQREDL